MPKKKQSKTQTVIACTCRVANYGWIKERRIYNLPLPVGSRVPRDRDHGYAAVTHIIVYAQDLPALACSAKYVRDVDAAWLAANDYKVSKQPHADRYALFELGTEATEAELLDNSRSDIYVCSTRWNGPIDADFFSRPLPKCDGKSVPNIFERIRPFLSKWHAAKAYNPVQMDFFEALKDCVSKSRTRKGKRPVAVDLFAGCGGLSLGFEQAGFDIVAAVEIDPVHAAVHEYNFPMAATICADIKNISGHDIRERAGLGDRDVDVIFGGAPCQGFSMIGKRALDDPRNQLIGHFLRIVRDIRPKYCVLENVKGLTLGKHAQFLSELIEELKKIDYNVLLPYRVLNAADYGVPQNRERLFLIAARSDQKLPSYPDTVAGKVTIREAIGDLPDADRFDCLWEDDSAPVKWRTDSDYARKLRGQCPDDGNFGYERNFDVNRLTASRRTMHGEISQQRFLAAPQGETEPHSRFFKLAWNGQSNTLRAGTDSARGGFTSPRPIHPVLPRVITVREAARIHSYPDWFRFNKTKWHGFREIGNSVPPLLARAVGRMIVKALGATPQKPTESIATGSEKLLELDMRGAADHFGVPHNVIAQRIRKNSHGK